MLLDLHSAYRSVRWADLRVSPLGLGLSRISSFTSRLSENEARQLVRTAFDAGINVYDTADIYGQGDSEKLLGTTLRNQRHDIVICTKVGYCVSAKARLAAYVKPLLKPIFPLVANQSARFHAQVVHRSRLRQNFSPEYVLSAIERSLHRLRTDHIDLLLLHDPPVSGFRFEEVHAALESAKRAGKIGVYGVSCRSLPDAETWVRWSGVSVLQMRLGRVEQEMAAGLLQEARVRNVGIIARQVLAQSGALTPDKTGARTTDSSAITAVLREPLNLADVVLVGTTRLEHLREDIAAVAGARFSRILNKREES